MGRGRGTMRRRPMPSTFLKGLALPVGSDRSDTPLWHAHRHPAFGSAAVAPGAHAVLLLDQAGWHGSRALVVPGNITLMPLPPKCPELNPVENVWQFMRDNWLSNRVFKSCDDILDQCCFAWNRLTDQQWRIMSLGLRTWPHRF